MARLRGWTAAEKDNWDDSNLGQIENGAAPLRTKTPSRQRARQIRLAPLTGTLSSPKLCRDGPFPAKRLLGTRFNRIQRPQQSESQSLDGSSTSISIPETISVSVVADLNDSPVDSQTDERAVSDAEESIWCGSDGTLDESEDELPSPKKFLQLPPKRCGPKPPKQTSDFAYRPKNHPSTEDLEFSTFSQPSKGLKAQRCDPSRPTSSSDQENGGAFLRYSPPRFYSPRKQKELGDPITPPQSPTKSRLQSPSKTRTRAPTPPLRQSLDNFWNSNAVNEWNDQHSPHKVLKSPKKLKFIRDESSKSPTSSPRKRQSPSKASQAEREAKKDFDSRKRAMAKAFFDELDEVVTEGEIKRLASSTDGVDFIWSKTLNSTAGRANWRKETSHTRMLDGTAEVRYKHHASIELAEKVIDDENRLLNVIAHEFCHLANFMVSGIKNEPHGRQFKAWGRKCTQAFKDRGVEVTTKHSYEIEYKYIWQCSNEDCAAEFKRHSKSIDTTQHTCGKCRSKLVQIKPTPRRAAGTSGYAAYVKQHFAEVKRSMPHASQKEIMEALGKKYRAEKAIGDIPAVDQAATSGAGPIDVDAVVRRLEVIVIDDD